MIPENAKHVIKDLNEKFTTLAGRRAVTVRRARPKTAKWCGY